MYSLLHKLIRPGFHHRRHAYLSRGIHWVLRRTGWYEHEDWKTEYVQEFLEEFANLRHDIGSDWGPATRKARKQYLMHMDALRNALDGDVLHQMWLRAEEQDDLYEDMVVDS